MEETFVQSTSGNWRVFGIAPIPATNHFDAAMTRAREVRLRAHAPYSKFRVGACALIDGEWFSGCNVENASYGATICAERNAIAAGIAAGRKKVSLIAITTGAEIGVPMGNRSPCGMCRQVISEFATDHTIVLLDGGQSNEYKFLGEAIAFDSLLPWQFDLGS